MKLADANHASRIAGSAKRERAAPAPAKQLEAAPAADADVVAVAAQDPARRPAGSLGLPRPPAERSAPPP